MSMPVTSNPSFHYIFCLSTLWPSHPLLRQGATDILVLESDSEPEVMSSQKDSGFGWGMMGSSYIVNISLRACNAHNKPYISWDRAFIIELSMSMMMQHCIYTGRRKHPHGWYVGLWRDTRSSSWTWWDVSAHHCLWESGYPSLHRVPRHDP